MGFNKLNLFLIQAILFVELQVDLRDGFGPINVGILQSLEGDIFPLGPRIVLCNL